jgi:hypothetical protein
MPGQFRQQRIGAAPDMGRKIAIAQIGRDGMRHVVHIVQKLHRAADGFHHPGEDADAVIVVALPACRDQVAAMLGQMLVHDHAPGFLVALGGARADLREDCVAAHFRRSFHICWKVLPCGAGKSRHCVQPDASGRLEMRPVPWPWLCSTRAARRVTI